MQLSTAKGDARFSPQPHAASPVLKDEHRTSNVQRPTSNEKRISNTEHSTAISVSFQPF
jgi:hypothetical protein